MFDREPDREPDYETAPDEPSYDRTRLPDELEMFGRWPPLPEWFFYECEDILPTELVHDDSETPHSRLFKFETRSRIPRYSLSEGSIKNALVLRYESEISLPPNAIPKFDVIEDWYLKGKHQFSVVNPVYEFERKNGGRSNGMFCARTGFMFPASCDGSYCEIGVRSLAGYIDRITRKVGSIGIFPFGMKLFQSNASDRDALPLLAREFRMPNSQYSVVYRRR